MGDGVGVPTFGEHGHGDDAADGVAQAASLAHGVHYLTQQVLVGDVLAGLCVAGAFDNLTAETFDFIGRHASEVVVQRFAGFELFTVDQQRFRAAQRVAVFVMIGKQAQAAFDQLAASIFMRLLEARDVVVNQLGCRSVVADSDEAGRMGDFFFSSQRKGFFVVTVERFERGLQLRRQIERVQSLGLAATLLGHLGADVLPQDGTSMSVAVSLKGKFRQDHGFGQNKALKMALARVQYT